MIMEENKPAQDAPPAFIKGRNGGRGGRSQTRGRGGGRGRGRGRRGGGRNVRTNAHYSTKNHQDNQTCLETNTKVEMPICTFYLAGRCNFGSKCRFYHPENSLLTEKQQQQIPQSKKSNKAREFDVFKAEAINMAKTAQDLELKHFATLEGPFYSMDLECVASGYGHSDKQRYPCRVSLVKEIDGYNDIEVVLDEIVNLTDVTVVSYMTELTGVSATECLDSSAKDLDQIRCLVKEHLPDDAILVGHSIQHDIEWLGLEPGVDFKQSLDTSTIFRQRIPRNLGSAGNTLRNQVASSKESEEDSPLNERESPSEKPEVKKSGYDYPDDTNLPFATKYRLFSLRHSCIHLLDVDIQEKAHNPIMDAKYSLLLFRKYKSASPELLRAVRDSLHRAPPTPSFAAENPVLGGVVLSLAGYRLKWAGRFIWKWWITRKGQKQNNEDAIVKPNDL